MLAHLLDGDLASNHLSWQWVAGTGSTKPYLFNADNVAKYAPSNWHNGGTVLDTSYEALGHIAQSPEPVAHGRVVGLDGFAQEVGVGVAVPALHTTPLSADWRMLDGSSGANEADVAGRDVFLLHPWSLGAQSLQTGDIAMCIGVAFNETHRYMPWSEHRWRFVTDGMRERTPYLWLGDVSQVAQALRHARSVHWQSEPHVNAQLQALQAMLGREQSAPNVVAHTPENLFAPVDSYCPSFSQWWSQTRLVV
jgi:deoxyribodipyrimidine photo-lyase